MIKVGLWTFTCVSFLFYFKYKYVGCFFLLNNNKVLKKIKVDWWESFPIL